MKMIASFERVNNNEMRKKKKKIERFERQRNYDVSNNNNKNAFDIKITFLFCTITSCLIFSLYNNRIIQIIFDVQFQMLYSNLNSPFSEL